MGDELPEEEDEEDRLAVAADNELDGPNNWVPPVPPATKPEELLELAAPVRMYRWRKSKGFV